MRRRGSPVARRRRLGRGGSRSDCFGSSARFIGQRAGRSRPRSSSTTLAGGPTLGSAAKNGVGRLAPARLRHRHSGVPSLRQPHADPRSDPSPGHHASDPRVPRAALSRSTRGRGSARRRRGRAAIHERGCTRHRSMTGRAARPPSRSHPSTLAAPPAAGARRPRAAKRAAAGARGLESPAVRSR